MPPRAAAERVKSCAPAWRTYRRAYRGEEKGQQRASCEEAVVASELALPELACAVEGEDGERRPGGRTVWGSKLPSLQPWMPRGASSCLGPAAVRPKRPKPTAEGRDARNASQWHGSDHQPMGSTSHQMDCCFHASSYIARSTFLDGYQNPRLTKTKRPAGVRYNPVGSRTAFRPPLSVTTDVKPLTTTQRAGIPRTQANLNNPLHSALERTLRLRRTPSVDPSWSCRPRDVRATTPLHRRARTGPPCPTHARAVPKRLLLEIWKLGPSPPPLTRPPRACSSSRPLLDGPMAAQHDRHAPVRLAAPLHAPHQRLALLRRHAALHDARLRRGRPRRLSARRRGGQEPHVAGPPSARCAARLEDDEDARADVVLFFWQARSCSSRWSIASGTKEA
jgi:hypothetical protein